MKQILNLITARSFLAAVSIITMMNTTGQAGKDLRETRNTCMKWCTYNHSGDCNKKCKKYE